MKAELNINTDELREQITQDVIKALKPLLNGRGEDDTIFTVKTLAKYLEVSEKWIYERTQFNEIPLYKMGGNVRFRKREIDRWLDAQKTPAINPLSSSLKIISCGKNN